MNYKRICTNDSDNLYYTDIESDINNNSYNFISNLSDESWVEFFESVVFIEFYKNY